MERKRTIIPVYRITAAIISREAASLKLLMLKKKKIKFFERFAPITQKIGMKISLKKEMLTSLTFVSRLKLRIKLIISLTNTTMT